MPSFIHSSHSLNSIDFIQLQYAYYSLWQSSNIPIPIWKFSITQLYTLENERILNPKMEASDDFPFQLPSKKLTLDIQTPAEKVFGPPQCAKKTPKLRRYDWMFRVRYP